VEAPMSVRAAAPLDARIVPGVDIRLAARPEDAFVFPCRDRATGREDRNAIAG
jgi:hypothetical protein